MRDATTAFIAEAAKQYGATLALFLRADFGPDAGVFALWNGFGVKQWVGIDHFSGLNLVSVEGGAENADGSTEPMEFKIGWKDVSTLKDWVQAAKLAKSGGRAYLARGFISDTGDIVADPIYIWSGRVGVPSVAEGPRQNDGSRSITVSCTCEQDMADKDRPLKFRITHASQLMFDPSDRGLAMQAKLSSEDLQWGLFYYKEEHSP